MYNPIPSSLPGKDCQSEILRGEGLDFPIPCFGGAHIQCPDNIFSPTFKPVEQEQESSKMYNGPGFLPCRGYKVIDLEPESSGGNDEIVC